jgi:hypothetical protein
MKSVNCVSLQIFRLILLFHYANYFLDDFKILFIFLKSEMKDLQMFRNANVLWVSKLYTFLYLVYLKKI